MVENRCFVLRACVNHFNANVADTVRRVFQEVASEQLTMARDSTKRHLRLKKIVVKVSFNRINLYH